MTAERCLGPPNSLGGGAVCGVDVVLVCLCPVGPQGDRNQGTKASAVRPAVGAPTAVPSCSARPNTRRRQSWGWRQRWGSGPARAPAGRRPRARRDGPWRRSSKKECCARSLYVLTLSRALVQATCAIRFYNVCHRSRAHLLSPRKERNMLKWVKHPPPFGQTPGRSHFTTRLTGGNGRWGGQSQLASHKPGERWGLARAPCVSLCKMQLASCKQLAQPTAVSD